MLIKQVNVAGKKDEVYKEKLFGSFNQIFIIFSLSFSLM